MINAGITKKIDDLGRIVIPKEIRKKLKIKEGDPLELLIVDEEKFYVKKYSSMKDITNYAEELSISVSKTILKSCIITDTDKIISVRR